MPERENNNLVSRLKLGDKSAMGELVNSHWERIFNRANSLLDNRQDAEEIAQDTFIHAQRGIASFRGECALSTWLYRIATNLAMNRNWYWWRRKRGSSVSLDAPVSEDEPSLAETLADCAEAPYAEASHREMLEALPALMAKLPPKYAEVLNLRNRDNLSYEEIARKLGTNTGTVKSRISRAREILRRGLEDYR